MRWEGYTAEDDTWEPASSFADKSIVENYRQVAEAKRAAEEFAQAAAEAERERAALQARLAKLCESAEMASGVQAHLEAAQTFQEFESTEAQ